MAIRVISDLAGGSPQQKVSQGEDVTRSAQTGGIEGASQFLGTIGDLQNIGGVAAQKVAGFLKQHGFGDGTVPQVPGALSGSQMFQILSAAAARRTGVDPRLARLATATMIPAAIGQAPTSQEIVGAVTKDRPLYAPQTKAGEYARTAAQFLPAAATPGSAARRMANVIVPALASETAGQATKGTKLEPYARIAGALVGGGATALVASPGPRTRILAEAVRGASDAQVGQARQLMETAQREGVQLTMAEAMQQVTNGATGMGRLQRVVEGTKSGSARTAPVMAARPGQVRQAITNFADTVAPATAEPSVIGTRARDVAQGSLNSVRQDINAAARPNYQAMAGDVAPDTTSLGVPAPRYTPGEGTTVPLERYNDLARNQAYRRALQEVRGDDLLNAGIAQLPDNDVSVMNEVVKHLDRNIHAAQQTVTNPAGNNQIAGLFQSARDQADALASEASPQWRAARDTVSTGRALALDPLEAGPLGKIAATDSVPTQAGALYPAQPLEGAPAETARAVGILNDANPTIAPDLTRQHLVNNLNEATQANVGGPNQWGGAKYAALVAGNPEQERTLLSGVGAAGGDTGRLSNIIDVLRGTGWRERPGSMTAYNAQDLEELGKAGMAGEVLRTGLNPPGMFREFGRRFQDWQMERNAGRLADAILASPQDAEAILIHARQVVPEGPALQTIEQLGIAAQQSRRPQLENQ